MNVHGIARYAISRSLAVWLLLFAVACSASMRQKTLHATHVSLSTATAAYEKWDTQQQKAIVDAATSLEAGEAAMMAYYARRAPLLEALVRAYQAEIAALQKDDQKSLQDMIKAVAAFKTALDGFTTTKKEP